MQATDMISKSMAQSVYFSLLGSLLHKECDGKTLSRLANDRLFAELPYADENEAAIRGKNMMYRWLESDVCENLTQSAYSDYLRLFVGPGKLLAPPWGSAYLTKNRLLFQAETLAVREYYYKYSLMIKNKYSEPDDHIGLELMFIANLAERNETNALKQFIREHMLTWCEQWAGDVIMYSESDFYPAVVKMVIGGLETALE